MKILLDTNALLWTSYKNDYNTKRIEPVKDIILSDRNEIYISAVSFWEIAIKLRIGKIHADINELILSLEKYYFTELHLTSRHTRILASLPMFHKDPFDHMIIAQAKYEEMIVITGDLIFKKYLPNTIVI